MKVNVYVDGFNLYYGLKGYKRTGGQYKWLDVGALCRLALPNDTINRIRYFTATITVQDDPQAPQRQQAYLRALRTMQDLTVDFGHFISRPKWAVEWNSPPGQPKKVCIHYTEEKGSDVNLATRLLCDAYAGDYEKAAIITNDSDLVMPIRRIIKNELKLLVEVFNPHKNVSHALKKVATSYTLIPEAWFAASQFPATVLDRRGRPITKPPGW